jgi:hypothetical protein
MMMKLVVVPALLALVTAYPKEEANFGGGLKHFDVSQLSEEFKMFELPDSSFVDGEEDCDKPVVKECVKCLHDHARLCVRNMHTIAPMVEKVAECEAEGSELAGKDKAWQEESLKWHKKVAECLAAGRPDAPVQDSLYLARRKRSPRFHDHEEGHHEGHHGGHHEHHGIGDPADGKCEHPAYESTPADNEKCWRDMRAHRAHCNMHMRKCSKLAACFGLGAEPSGAADKAWYTFMKAITTEKKDKIVSHKKDLLVCTGKLPAETTHDAVKAHLWGDSED